VILNKSTNNQMKKMQVVINTTFSMLMDAALVGIHEFELASAVGGSCTSLQFKCVSTGSCIPGGWLCDRECDCVDCSDECGMRV